MSQYWTNDCKTSNKKIFDFDFRNKKIVFNSDDNVFSKSEVDFGSLLLVETVLDDGKIRGKCLDLGCGYGTIAILLGLNSDTHFVLCDTNERAVELAKQNCTQNGLENTTQILVSDVCSNVKESDFDFVISNPPIRVGNSILFEFFKQSFEKLKIGGFSYWVLRKQQGAETYTKKLKEIYGNAEVINKKKSFWIVRCQKTIRN